MSPTAARKVAAAITFTPGTVSSRLASGQLSICLATVRSTCSISASRKSICRSADPKVSASSTARRCRGCSSQRRPFFPKMSEHGGLPCSVRINTACTSFFARVRARTSCSRRSSRRRSTRTRSSGVHTASSSPFHSRVASVRASILSVFARACAIPVSSGLTTTTRSQRPSSRLATSHAELETSITTRSVGSRLPASVSIPSAVIFTLPPPYVCPDSQIAISRTRDADQDRSPDPATRAPVAPSPRQPPPSRITRAGERVGERQRPIRAQSTPGRVAGAARKTSPRSKRIVQNGLPSCVLHNKNPCAR
jgi:hypothetical protein